MEKSNPNLGQQTTDETTLTELEKIRNLVSNIRIQYGRFQIDFGNILKEINSEALLNLIFKNTLSSATNILKQEIHQDFGVLNHSKLEEYPKVQQGRLAPKALTRN